MKQLDATDVVSLLQDACSKAGSQTAWARLHKIIPSSVSATLAGRLDPGPAILAALNLERVVTYRKRASHGAESKASS